MSSHARVPAVKPEDLERLFVARVNAGDVEGLVELYEPDAVMAFLPRNVATGCEAIRQVFKEFVWGKARRLGIATGPPSR